MKCTCGICGKTFEIFEGSIEKCPFWEMNSYLVVPQKNDASATEIETIPQEKDMVTPETETTPQAVYKIPAINTTPQTREETLELLYEVGRTAEDVEYLTSKISSLKQNIDSENKKAEALRNAISGTITAIKWIALICSVFTWDTIPIIPTIIVWFVMKLVVQYHLSVHKSENDSNAERYILEHVNPLMVQLQNNEDQLTALTDSGLIEWAKDIVGKDLFSSVCINDLYELVKNRRADSLKEVLNLYDDVQHRARMEEMQATIQNASVAAKQTAYAKETARSSEQAARAAKANARTAKANAHYTREIEKIPEDSDNYFFGGFRKWMLYLCLFQQ